MVAGCPVRASIRTGCRSTRETLRQAHADATKIGAAELIDVLRSAGFAEARSIAQIGGRHLVVAIR
jgi:hypothetical protein